jgi:hypothetical protein
LHKQKQNNKYLTNPPNKTNLKHTPITKTNPKQPQPTQPTPQKCNFPAIQLLLYNQTETFLQGFSLPAIRKANKLTKK